MKLWKKVLIGLLIAGGTLGYLVYTMLDAQKWRCEVCITYKGRKNCSAARGENKRAAYSTAANSACATLTSGVTERFACPSTPPTSHTCKER